MSQNNSITSSLAPLPEHPATSAIVATAVILGHVPRMTAILQIKIRPAE